MNPPRVTSRRNPLIKTLRRLGADPAFRRAEGLFLADGRKLLDEALREGFSPRRVIVSDGTELPALPDTTDVTVVPPGVMGAASPLSSPQGILFTCPIPSPPPLPPQRGKWLLLDRLQDPGNVGSVLRTAEAFALDGVLLTEGCADPFSPKAVRASMGAVFRLPIAPVSVSALGPLPLYAADIGENATPVRDIQFGDCVVALGNEGRGLRPELLRKAKKVITIPMRGRAESLGVAAAAAVICCHMGGY
ncbi:MAG: RNA methyltransferase [Oscillospiraceae bacterium]|nr:RNA methyltransferase [Oscillospiraceae bacterium]